MPRWLTELIADGVHVDAGFTRLVFATAAPGRVVLVTDATAAAGMPDGSYVLGPLLVAVSGYGQDDHRQQSKRAGFDYHMVKPIDPAMMTDLLASIPASRPHAH